MSETLLPCPFCGKPAKLIIHDEGPGECCDIACQSPAYECFLSLGADWYLPRDEIVDMWNRRATLTILVNGIKGG